MGLVVATVRPYYGSGQVFGYPFNRCARDLKAQSQENGKGQLAWQRSGFESIEPVLKM